MSSTKHHENEQRGTDPGPCEPSPCSTKSEARGADAPEEIAGGLSEIQDVSPRTDPALWTTRRAFGVAGGPVEVVLTDDGNARAFSVGAQVRHGQAAAALEALYDAGGEGHLSERGEGARIRATALGRYDQVTWGHLRALGYVESLWSEQSGDGVRLTAPGKRAVQSGIEERARCLSRCRAVADALAKRGAR